MGHPEQRTVQHGPVLAFRCFVSMKIIKKSYFAMAMQALVVKEDISLTLLLAAHRRCMMLASRRTFDFFKRCKQASQRGTSPLRHLKCQE